MPLSQATFDSDAVVRLLQRQRNSELRRMRRRQILLFRKMNIDEGFANARDYTTNTEDDFARQAEEHDEPAALTALLLSMREEIYLDAAIINSALSVGGFQETDIPLLMNSIMGLMFSISNELATSKDAVDTAVLAGMGKSLTSLLQVNATIVQNHNTLRMITGEGVVISNPTERPGGVYNVVIPLYRDALLPERNLTIAQPVWMMPYNAPDIGGIYALFWTSYIAYLYEFFLRRINIDTVEAGLYTGGFHQFQ